MDAISYDGKADPVKHVSHYIQMMSLYIHNDMLMCKVFPSSLGPTILRWFNGLRKGSIHNFEELIQEFNAQFMTCSRVSQPVDALLSMKMRDRETLRSYANRCWELYNEIGRGNKKVAANTFKLVLPEDLELRDLLTMRSLENMRQLMRWIEEYKRLEDDWQQNKAKVPATSQYAKDSRTRGFKLRRRRELRIKEPNVWTGEVNVVFKKPVHKILEWIKNGLYF
ncbi:uncharacterized protein LOC115951811 [Quercus lobata]|uniref:uncharacterized protein LOC115951811 n=1 Tax=Quercus lobata TaxID=97700 RepID=UPI00124946FA|nr:uncharacterized protein LOC115951811 [Quercus lobata]